MSEFGPTSGWVPTPPGQVFADIRAAVEMLNAMPPIVARFEVPPALDAELRALATVRDLRVATYESTLQGVPWTVDETLNPRQFRTHWSDGTEQVHDL